jgi:Subtilase family
MLRRMVVLRERTRISSLLAANWRARAFSHAGGALDKHVGVRGVSFHLARCPIPVAYGARYAAVALCEDQEAAERLKYDCADRLAGIFADPAIRAAGLRGSPSAAAAVGTSDDVRSLLDVSSLQRAGLTGKGIRVAVVDSGINGVQAGPDKTPLQQSIHAVGWAPEPGYQPGSAPLSHGTMVAFDVLLAAPKATLLDYALLGSTKTVRTGFLSDACTAFAELLEQTPGPLIVNNSWAMDDQEEDEPIGSPGNYSANPDHPLNQLTGALVAAGADVLFAAGNCAADRPDAASGVKATGPGAGIHGANSHPLVITIAAVTVEGARLVSSSPGPGSLNPKKPDLAAFSRFVGSGVFPVDDGTSAATSVAAGAVAALRQLAPTMSPSVLKGVLQSSARRVGATWTKHLGHGILDVRGALKALEKNATPGSDDLPSTRRRTMDRPASQVLHHCGRSRTIAGHSRRSRARFDSHSCQR